MNSPPKRRISFQKPLPGLRRQQSLSTFSHPRVQELAELLGDITSHQKVLKQKLERIKQQDLQDEAGDREMIDQMRRTSFQTASETKSRSPQRVQRSRPLTASERYLATRSTLRKSESTDSWGRARQPQNFSRQGFPLRLLFDFFDYEHTRRLGFEGCEYKHWCLFCYFCAFCRICNMFVEG